MKIGQRVRVVRQNFGHHFIGNEGIITSIGKGVIPIHVKLDIDINLPTPPETDFAENELEVV